MKQPLLVLFMAALLPVPGSAQDIAAGGRQFASRCAGCHGVDGGGGEYGPNIVDTRRFGQRSGRDLADVIKNGIQDSGMPAFPLPQPDIDSLVAFVNSLRAPAADHPAPGDIAAGERFFSGKGNCSNCHMVKGRGGNLGPDLSNLGRELRLAQITQALRNPGMLQTPGYHLVSLHLKDGTAIRGLVKNESNYDLQLQTLDGSLRLVEREQIADETREPAPLMPAVKATDEEMRDLLAFLSRLALDRSPDATLAGGSSTDAGAPFAAIANPKPGEWPSYHGHLSGNRYSPLEEINTESVARLAAKWMFPIGNSKRLEVTPVVVDGVMYVTTANEVYALDARSGRQIWHYARPLTKGVIGDAESGINRGVAVLGDKVFMATDNAHMIALDRTTGHLLWDTEMADFRNGYGATSAPLVVNDLVLSGTSGGDEGARGFVAAFRTDTGQRAWQFWAMPAPGEPGSETWVGRAIEHGCVTGWLTGTYDPTTGLVYWPTGNPCPDYNGDERKGDNLYSSSVVALEAKTGKLRWYFQFTPHDLHDWDAAETPMLVDAEFHGQPRKLLAQANRNGFFYVLDRVTGEFLLGQPFVHKLTWASGIDAKGRPELLPGSEPSLQGAKVCPSVIGATNWNSSAYNPATGLFYVMALESCAIYTKSSAWWEPGKSFYGGGNRHVPGETNQKFLRAIDLQTGKIVWEVPQIASGFGLAGVLTTAGGLVFFGDDSGAFAAVDAKTGKSLWHFHTNESWHSSPMTYAVGGKQYLGVSVGSNIVAFTLP
jgi:PQQ-dependent dehydrogenase (methanol/ethanol family)